MASGDHSKLAVWAALVLAIFATPALARAGKIKPTPMKEEPMADVQKWIEELRAGKVVGRIVLKN